MLIVNTETIPGYNVVRVLGLVQGNTIRAKHAGKDIMAGLKSLVGGELKGYTELLTESRREAMVRITDPAHELAQICLVNVRFSASSITQGAAELYAYGTAVIVQPIQ